MERVQLSDGPIYVPEDSDTAMQAPERTSFLFFFFLEMHGSQFNGPHGRKASPLYRFVTYIPSHGSAGRWVGKQTGVPP